MEKSYTPYTYLIGWSHLNKWYYGVETKNVKQIAHPSNLWKTYFTSSKIVSQMRNDHGEPDVVEIRQTFLCPEKAFKWEQRVLKKMEIWKHDHWINQAIQDGPYPMGKDICEKRVSTRRKNNKPWHSDQTKRKIGTANKGKKPQISDELRKKRSEMASYRNKHDQNMIQNQRAHLVERWNAPGAREKQAQIAKDRFLNPEALQKKKLAQSTLEHKALKNAIGVQQWGDRSKKMKEGFKKHFSDPVKLAEQRERTILMHQKKRGWDYLMMDGIKFRTIQECASHFNKCIKTVRKLIKSGVVPTHLEDCPP